MVHLVLQEEKYIFIIQKIRTPNSLVNFVSRGMVSDIVPEERYTSLSQKKKKERIRNVQSIFTFCFNF